MEQKRTSTTGLALLGISLAAGIIAAALIFAHTVEKIKLSAGSVHVKGYAERTVTSDIASWYMKITARDADLATAYSKIQNNLDIVYAFLKKSGIPKNEITTWPVKTIVQYVLTEKGISTNQIEGYTLSQDINVTSNNVYLIAQLSSESSSLIQKGIEFSSYNQQYFVSSLDNYKLELLGEATKNARLRAEQLAVNSGCRIGFAKSASQGVFQITPVNSTQVSNYGVYDTSTIRKSIKAVVTVNFSLRR